jgi:deoxyribodipyrimidine photolyase-related protein
MKINRILVVLGDQLFPLEFLEKTKCRRIFMAEDLGLCTASKHHKLKILMFLSAMRAYRDALVKRGFEVFYHAIGESDFLAPFEQKLKLVITKEQITEVNYFEIEDHFFADQLDQFRSTSSATWVQHPSPKFLCTREKFFEFSKGKKTLRMASFYQMMRRDLDLLMVNNEPVGGRWSFDEENRKKLPVGLELPDIPSSCCANQSTLKHQIEEHFADHPGPISNLWMPITRDGALRWLDEFLVQKFADFGKYEDAVHDSNNFLFHSALSTSLNMGLLTPLEVVGKAINFYEHNDVPINSVEGFVRQIIGWREFIRGVYDIKRKEQIKSNFWGHSRRLTSDWYDGTTGITPLDDTIRDCREFGYTHHIPRLMIVANLMTLARIDPREVYAWFMEMFVDSADWVMVPNVFGMGTFADGGIFSTKPYICGSNYIIKMSNYKKGHWSDIVDGLYWSFIHDNLEPFKRNPRSSFMTKNLERIDSERKTFIFDLAKDFIATKTTIL